MFDIIFPIIIVTAIGLICGIILAVASKFMSVKVNEKEEKLRDCLPGANCGACGYTGCDGYAKALAEDPSLQTNLCVPGAEAVSIRIADILGVKAQNAEKFTAYVLCHGDCNSTYKKHIYDGIMTCAAEALYYGSSSSCTFGCIGLGDCAKVCPEDAICVKDGLARIDRSKCIGCGMCARTCPKHVIGMIPANGQHVVGCSNRHKGIAAKSVCSNACISCHKCEKVCPSGAVSVIDNLARIDYSKCTNCGACQSACPIGCIRFVKYAGKQL